MMPSENSPCEAEENMAVTLATDLGEITVPGWVTDLASFRRWAHSDDFPEKCRICFLQGGVWIETGEERVFSYALVKTKFTIALGGLVEAEQLGVFLQDGAFVTNRAAGLAAMPGAVFASNATLEGRARLVEGRRGHIELEGSPDMVLEVVSDRTVRKDTLALRRDYWEAGVREYWLVDARPTEPSFDVLRHTARGFRAARKKDGWVESAVFTKAFRLTRLTDARGRPDYRLEMR
jgi:hypothetical protein